MGHLVKTRPYRQRPILENNKYLPRNQLQLFIDTFRPKKQRKIELIGNEEQKSLNKERMNEALPCKDKTIFDKVISTLS